jgi:hypothetical protein
VPAGDIPFNRGWFGALSGFLIFCNSTASASASNLLLSESPHVGIAGSESSDSSFLETSNVAYCGGSAAFVRAGAIAPAVMAGSER